MTHSSTLQPLPRPEYPRPDWQRDDWFNLNGQWSFLFDPNNQGTAQHWHQQAAAFFTDTITVPFSWSSPLSGIGSEQAGIGWYYREINWQPKQAGQRLFLRFGAVDYTADVWINGIHLGTHHGGYGSFEFEVSAHWHDEQGSVNRILVRAEDNDHAFQARGKQGYGEIRGIWQPVWLEARPFTYMEQARFTTALDGTINVNVVIQAQQDCSASLRFSFNDGAVQGAVDCQLQQGRNPFATSFVVSDPQLWSPDDPHLYEGSLCLDSTDGIDTVHTYFGIREIGTQRFGTRDYRWITLNGKPVYLNGTLDQSFHPTGFFTYPSDTDMYDEIYLMKRLGLNMVRIHIKPEEPRKLYWADKLGILVMEDMPCFWGNPDEAARAAYEQEAREVIERDFNHPSIFSWVMFNETWGLKTDSEGSSLTSDQLHPNHYLPQTQEWVRTVYHWAKQLDPSRIIEDNSPCNWDHVASDLNTWHFYINGYEEVRKHVEEVVEQTYVGSTFNYIGGNVQSDAPLMNSECGNVWGIEGGAGDSDLAWHYRYMLNEFRRHDKLCGFVFTEFRDVTNEFNGYYRLDGQEKHFGYEAFVPGMSLRDLHAPEFIVIDAPPCQTVGAGSEVSVPLLASLFSDRYFGQSLQLHWELWHDDLGTHRTVDSGQRTVQWDDYGTHLMEPLTLLMPTCDAVAVLSLRLATIDGLILTRNFTTFDVQGCTDRPLSLTDGDVVQLPVSQYAACDWPYHQSALQAHKISGGPSGYFQYEIDLANSLADQSISEIALYFEAGAKRLLVRDIDGAAYKRPDLSFMHGAKSDTERNPNTYYMSDEQTHPAKVLVQIDGETIACLTLPDDPADSRGVLSWHYQSDSRKLEDAGSYGYLCRVTLPGRLLAQVNRHRRFTLTLAAEEGGLALYGRNAGRYPIDLLLHIR